MNRMKKFFTAIILALVMSNAAYAIPITNTIIVEAATVALNKKSITVYVGDTYTLKLNGTTKLIKWTSSNKKIATVSPKGIVKGVKKGSCTITATVGSKKYTCKVTVKSPGISKTKLTMEKASETTLKINGVSGKVTWKSADKSIATVNSKGEVVAKNEGTVKITGTVNGKTYTCTVTVLKGKIQADVTELTLSDASTVIVSVDDLQADENLLYEIKDTSIIDVEQGDWVDNEIPLKVIPKKNGKTTITITTDYKAEELIINVTVKGMTNGNSTGTNTGTTGNGSNNNSSTNTGSTKLTAEEVYALCAPSSVQINTDTSIGSGFFIAESTVVTNYHVIEGAKAIEVQLLSGEKYSIDKVLGYSPELDIAVLGVSIKRTPLVKNTHGVTNGETIYAIGSSQGLTDTYTLGIVSNPSRKVDNVEYIQHTAPITNGNSGGPLLNSYGEVMGINTWQYIDGQNLNFAINIKELDRVSLANPMSASSFYNLGTSGGSNNSGGNNNQSGSGDAVIYEDTNVSNSMRTAQTIKSGAFVYGVAGYSIDFYKFTLSSKSEVIIIATNVSDYYSDYENLYVAIYDANDYIVAAATPDYDAERDMYYYYIDEVINAGTYYVNIFSAYSYPYDIPYMFMISY